MVSFATGQGKLWVGTYGWGVKVFDRNRRVAAELNTDTGFPDGSVNALFEDSRGGVWIATRAGLGYVRDTRRPDSFLFMVMSMVWRTFSYVPFKKTRMEGYGFPPTMASLIGMNGNSGLRIMITVMGSRWEISLNGRLAGGRMVRFISVR